MDAALKYKIVEKIIQSEDDAVLNKIKSLLGIQDKDFWHELPLCHHYCFGVLLNENLFCVLIIADRLFV
ncbi:hypothetical protein [Olivibacter sitiensis]|uniref:hypothetical protein n=1 Tax=Olivibacter sitiensis TaxID=376470 RepID=UPI000428499A|nr:hypothetical protein [Olivibacter sitiensis]